MGAGDLLMSFLGVVILSFGFRIFGQRRLMKRHRARDLRRHNPLRSFLPVLHSFCSQGDGLGAR